MSINGIIFLKGKERDFLTGSFTNYDDKTLEMTTVCKFSFAILNKFLGHYQLGVKGQVILKGLFRALEFSQKMNE